MTTTFTDRPRRQTPTPPRPPRELPVLFHLLDVSRPKGYAASSPAELPLTSPATFPEPIDEREPTATNHAAETSVSSALAEAFDLETAASLAETSGLGTIPPAPLPPAAEEVKSDKCDSAVASEPPANDIFESTNDDHSGSSTSLAAPSPAPADEAVTPRQRAQERQRKRQAATKGDWFTSHGKVIAIGFVLALLATIYMARTNRKPSAPPVASKATKQPARTIKSVSAEQSIATKSSSASPAVAITRVSPSEKQPAGESRTALHPPTIPQLAQEPATAKSPDESLFPWARRDNERVATRTDPGTLPSMSPTPPQVEQPQAAAPPPQYPSTNYRGDYQPAAAPTQYGPVPQPNAAPGATYGPTGGQPSYPTTNTASGYRHERTGSGFH
jgi:hypothetical protein